MPRSRMENRMHKFLLPALALLGSTANTSAAPSTKKTVKPYRSATFAEILSRVQWRDKETSAILRVKARPDAGGHNHALDFTIEVAPEDAKLFTVALSGPLPMRKGGSTAFEKYLLLADDAMRAELANQAKFAQLQAERKKKYESEQTAKIEELTKGALKFGMAFPAVKKLKGAPRQVVAVATQFGTMTWIYPDWTLRFAAGYLHDVTATAPEAVREP